MRKLSSRKQEFLYGLSGFGPNFLMLILGAYLLDAYVIEGFGENVENWTYFNKTIVYVVAFGALLTITKIIDAVVDVPLAAFTDRLKTKWGKRRPAILIGLILLIAFYIIIVIMPQNVEHSLFNTIMIPVVVALFYTAYTLAMVTYYGTFSEITRDTKARMRLSNYKAFFDTVYYSIGYALIPLFIKNINISQIAIVVTPIALTMIIPLFMIKEPSTRKEDVVVEPDKPAEKNVSMWKSIRIAFSNKNYLMWMLVFGFFFFGLQLFLTAQNVLASGPMGLTSTQITLMNTAAFAPVPLMLFFYNRLMKKKGFGFAFKTAIISFILAMSCFAVAYIGFFPGSENQLIRLMIGLTGSTIGSYGIGTFFMALYMIPSQLAKEETERTGRNISAMFFAVQGFINAIIGALSTGLVWFLLRDWEIEAGDKFGTWFSTIVVIVFCATSLGLSFLLPKAVSDIGKTPIDTLKLTEELPKE